MNEISTRGILHRTANEVTSLAELAEDIDAAISRLPLSTLEASLCQRLQEIDLLHQSLCDVAHVVHRIAQDIDVDAITNVDLLQDLLRLHDLRVRLLHPSLSEQPSATANGHVALF